MWQRPRAFRSGVEVHLVCRKCGSGPLFENVATRRECSFRACAHLCARAHVCVCVCVCVRVCVCSCCHTTVNFSNFALIEYKFPALRGALPTGSVAIEGLPVRDQTCALAVIELLYRC